MERPGEVELRDGFASVTRGTLFLLVSTLCLVLLNFLGRVLLVRSISTDDWNHFSFGFALAQVVAAVGSLGLPIAVARSLPYAGSDAERRTIVRSSLWVGLGAAGVAGVSLWVSAPVIGSELGSPAISLGLDFFAVAIASTISAGLIASIFQGYADVTPNAVFLQIVNPLLFLAFLGAALFLPGRITYLAALVGYALASVLTLGTLAAYCVRRLPRYLSPGPRDPSASGRLLRFTAPLFVVGAMVSLAGTGDTLILGVFHSDEIGTYSASVTLARLVPIGIGAASYIFLPVASRFLRLGDRAALRLTFATLTKWLTLFSLPLFLLFFFLPTESLFFVYGSNYSSTVVPLQVTVVGSFALTLLGPAAMAQVAFGEARLLAYNSVAAAMADVGIAFWLVPSHGYLGAAIAWSVANVLYSALCLAELSAAHGVHPFDRTFVVPLLVTLGPVAVALLVFDPYVAGSVLVAIGLGLAALFGVVVLVSRSVNEGDRLLLETIEGLLGRRVPFVRRLAHWLARVPVRPA